MFCPVDVMSVDVLSVDVLSVDVLSPMGCQSLRWITQKHNSKILEERRPKNTWHSVAGLVDSHQLACDGVDNSNSYNICPQSESNHI